MVNDTSRLLGLEGLAVVGVKATADDVVVHLVTAYEQAGVCPECGALARRLKGLGDNPAAGSTGRWPPASAGLAQASLVLRSAVVSAGLVHRGRAAGAGA
jgi:hypothetical protein